MKLFPLNAGASQIRGIIDIIKANKNIIDVSRLAEETNNDIAELFPLIDACVMLGLCKVKDGTVKLTKTGAIIDNDNKRKIFTKALNKVEPFRSASAIIKHSKEISTLDLSRKLYKKRILFNSDEITNIELLKGLLFKWGIENKLFSYNSMSDMWSK